MTANASSYFALLRNDSSSFEVGRQLGLEEIRVTLFNTPLDEWRFAYTRSTNPLEGTRSQSATSIATNFLSVLIHPRLLKFESSATSAP
jgi:hypothetical protein